MHPQRSLVKERVPANRTDEFLDPLMDVLVVDQVGFRFEFPVAILALERPVVAVHQLVAQQQLTMLEAFIALVTDESRINNYFFPIEWNISSLLSIPVFSVFVINQAARVLTNFVAHITTV